MISFAFAGSQRLRFLMPAFNFAGHLCPLRIEEAGMSDYLKMLEQQQALLRATDPLGIARSQLDALTLAGVRSQIYAATIASVGNPINALDLEAVRSQIDALSLTPTPDISVLAGLDRHLTPLTVSSVSERLLLTSAFAADAQNALQSAAGIDRSLATSFRYPGLDESIFLARQAIDSDLLASKIFGTGAELQAKMLDMNHPWLRPDAASSALGFAAMQAMGGALDRFGPFEIGLSLALRKNLGDWRDVAAPALPTMLDAQLRSGFYYERGFNPSLTAFSEGAFADSAELAGLIARRPATLDSGDGDEDEIGLRRNKEAFDQLQRFETAIRRFIDARMCAVFGEKWVKRQTPQKIYESWLDKKEKAIKAGEPERSLIEYADFSDYRIIIERSDNWNAAFQSIFVRVEDVRESLQRLQPVRIATMHARWITLDDEALLIFETKRLLKAFAKS
jgi:hypothetical protein